MTSSLVLLVLLSSLHTSLGCCCDINDCGSCNIFGCGCEDDLYEGKFTIAPTLTVTGNITVIIVTKITVSFMIVTRVTYTIMNITIKNISIAAMNIYFLTITIMTVTIKTSLQ